MTRSITAAKRAAIEFSLQWRSPYGQHNDRWYAERIDFWRDIFPGELHQRISSLSVGESCREDFAAGCLVEPYTERRVIEFTRSDFTGSEAGTSILPEPGKFYPQGYAWRGLHSFSDNTTPFRLIAAGAKTLVADTNHPLAKFPLTIGATMVEILDITSQRGGALNDISELLTRNGPGMQIPDDRSPMNPYREYPFTRTNDEDDSIFYGSPRLVPHLDSTARTHVREIYGRLLAPGTRILDLMSSWDSHLPKSLANCQVTGIGLNEEEMRKNDHLAISLTHDLNRQPTLPCRDQHFDAVICTVSIEYLIRPREVIAEVARVLRPGGIFVIIVSDRWFPGKEIHPWADLHPFERQGLVVSYLLQQKKLTNLHTESLRGYPRPVNDLYTGRTSWSDPLFVVYATKEVCP